MPLASAKVCSDAPIATPHPSMARSLDRVREPWGVGRRERSSRGGEVMRVGRCDLVESCARPWWLFRSRLVCSLRPAVNRPGNGATASVT